LNFIERCKLKEDYINVFNKLNDINSNYSSIFLKCYNDKDIIYLKDFNINFNKIKNLNIKIDYSKDKFDYNLFYRELFFLKDIENNIVDLYINNNDYDYYKKEIDENILENLNKFKKLENLKLNGIKAKNIFELKIKTLKTLNIDRCVNIYINSDIALHIKKLIFPYDKISKSLLNLPQLEYLENAGFIFDFIDFNSLNNLKKIKFRLNEKEFTKIISIKSLKEIYIISNDDIYNINLGLIQDKNPSVNKLIYKHVKYYEYDQDPNYNINEILNKFPNLTELIFITNADDGCYLGNGDLDDGESNLEIKENSSCKINKISLFIFFGYIKVFCQNFENLEKFEIEANKILNISDSIPMFSNNRNIIYNCLNELKIHLIEEFIDLEIFKNLNNSIDNMPNLKKIELSFKANIDRNTYEEFIKKILSLKLELINININFRFDDENNQNTNENYNNYSLEELKKINKNILYLNYEKIKINKYPIVNNSKIKKD